MLSAEDNRLLTESSSGTPMGDLFRRFWLPVLLSRGDPGRRRPPQALTVTGRGPARVPRHARPHRHRRSRTARTAAPTSSSGATRTAAYAASTTAGSSTSTAAASRCRPSRPTATPGQASDQGAIPARERGGMIWAYMGPPEQPTRSCRRWSWPGAARPPLRHQKLQDCNWVQAMEGSIDTAHFSFAAPHLRQAGGRGPRHPAPPGEPAVTHELRPRALDRRRPAPRDSRSTRTTPGSSLPAGASPATTTSTGASPSS